jgi:hypothetical protein
MKRKSVIHSGSSASVMHGYPRQMELAAVIAYERVKTKHVRGIFSLCRPLLDYQHEVPLNPEVLLAIQSKTMEVKCSGCRMPLSA